MKTCSWKNATRWFCLLTGLSGMPIRAADMDVLSRPIATEGEPTEVLVAMGLLDVDEIDSANQSFIANLLVRMEWKDPRLAHDGPGKTVRPMIEIWNPRLQFVNQQKVFSTFPEIACIEPDGTVVYWQRVWGPFSQPLEVHDFPFDIQDFEMRMAPMGLTADDVRFVKHPDVASGLADSFSLPDWKVLNWELNFDPYRPMKSMKSVPSFALVFHAKRYASSFVVKVIIPLFLIVCMSGIVFWIDPQQSGTQIGVATTSMLTLIAYRFMVGGLLPPVPYLTKIDYFILGSTLLVFVALIQAVSTSIMCSRDKTEQARKLDVWFRFLYALATFGVAVGSLMA